MVSTQVSTCKFHFHFEDGGVLFLSNVQWKRWCDNLLTIISKFRKLNYLHKVKFLFELERQLRITWINRKWIYYIGLKNIFYTGRAYTYGAYNIYVPEVSLNIPRSMFCFWQVSLRAGRKFFRCVSNECN